MIGPTPASEWGTMEWGTDNWGETKDFELEIDKWLFETFSFTDSIFKSPSTKRTESVNFSTSVDLVALQDGSGYDYFDRGSSDPSDRYYPDYSEDTGSTPTYTPDTATDPGWSSQS